MTDAYTYNPRSEVIIAQTYQSTSSSNTATPALGRSFAYTYDSIGSRTTSSVDGISTGYTNNSLNQLVGRSIPAQYTVSGFAPTGATVTVNGTAISASQIQGQYYLQNIVASNISGPLSVLAQCVSSYGGTISRNAFVRQSPEVLTYDNDGNLLSDGQWHYWWDAENRLIAMETYGNQPGDSTAVWNSGLNRQRIAFAYDYVGRRIDKQVFTWSTNSFVLSSESRSIFDGWNDIADYAITDGVANLTDSYIWGLDVSGTRHKGGGVAGLVTVVTASGAQEIPVYDGNGNIYGYVDRQTSTLTAEYEYSPYGETVRSTGAYAAIIPYRFATKMCDPETNLIYYGHRYYNPQLGRWISRDPSGEKGGNHLYGFVANNPLNKNDYNGLNTFQIGVTYNFYVGPVNFTGSAGFVFDSHGNVGTYGYGGAGPGLGGAASVGLSLLGSTGNTINDLKDAFFYASGSAGAGVNASPEFFAGTDSQGHPVIGGGVTIGLGGGAGIGSGITFTQINGGSSAPAAQSASLQSTGSASTGGDGSQAAAPDTPTMMQPVQVTPATAGAVIVDDGSGANGATASSEDALSGNVSGNGTSASGNASATAAPAPASDSSPAQNGSPDATNDTAQASDDGAPSGNGNAGTELGIVGHANDHNER